jgi:chemotaxis protein methyltransferase CheR
MSAPTTDDYTAFCAAIKHLTKLDLGQYKRGQMERRIRTFASKEGHADLTGYAGVLRQAPAELERFLDRITINVSQLWRNPEQWRKIGRDILPALAAEGPVRAWSAGCSYGAEAYTLAALCLDAIPKSRFEIRGTDIDPRMVERAREGRFSAEDARDAPRDALRRHFDADGDGWQAKPALRRHVRFDQGDLLRMSLRPASLDLILCRNTVIYFTEDVRDALHARLVGALRPGGVLVVGSTERVSGAAQLGLAAPSPFVYRKEG